MKRKALAMVFAGAVFGIPTVLQGAANFLRLWNEGRYDAIIVATIGTAAACAILFNLTRNEPWD